MFILFLICTNLFIFFYFLKRLLNVLFGDKEMTSGNILITGCDSGFGYATALELNKRNIYVFAGCLTAEGVQRFTDDDNFKGMAFIMNITKKEDINNARNIIEEKVKDKGLSCLLNNAGIYQPGPIEWMSEEDMKNTMDINLWGAVNVTKVMIPLVKKARGRIVNTTSIAGRISAANLGSYCMSKYALEAFSDSLRYEMKPWGISVHIIEPGFHGTDLYTGLQNRWKTLWDIQPDEIQQEYGENFYKDVLTASKAAMSKINSNPEDVINAYLHATLSARPRLRYVVGRDANTIGMALASLPTAMGDFIRYILFKRIIPAAAKNAK